MILFDLKCSEDHTFETWFRDSAAFEKLKAKRQIACPVCGDVRVAKAPMAPRIATKKGSGKEASSPSSDIQASKALTELRRHVEESCNYVGNKFPDEARKIHYGETEKRSIYGEATSEEAHELSEEGVQFQRLPWPSRQHS